MNNVTFLPRTHKNSNTKNGNTIDAIKLIDYILSLDADNRIYTNGSLYKLATKQYNDAVVNSLERPPIPSWFCGKIDSSTGLLINTDTDVNLRVLEGLTTPETLTTLTSTGSSLLYDNDKCLDSNVSYSTPGNPIYAQCSLGKEEDTDIGVDVNTINWSTQVYSVAVAGSSSCMIYDSGGNLIEVGKYNGTGDFNGPPSYLFSKRGGDYGRNIKLKSAGRMWNIPDGNSTIIESEFRWYPVSEKEGTLLVGIYVNI